MIGRGVQRGGWPPLIAEGEPYERVDIIGRAGHPDVDSCIQLQVCREPVSQAQIHGSNPGAACFIADRAEELCIPGQRACNIVGEGDTMDELRMIAATLSVADDVQLGHQPHPPTGWQIHRQRNDQAPLH